MITYLNSSDVSVSHCVAVAKESRNRPDVVMGTGADPEFELAFTQARLLQFTREL